MTHKRHNKLVKIITLALLVNFGLANFAFANNHTTAVDGKIDGATWLAAQVGLQSKPFNTTACLTTFQTLVTQVTNNTYKTGWYEVTERVRAGYIGTGKAVCVVVPANASQVTTGADRGRVEWSKLSEYYTAINQQLAAGGSITEKGWTAARTKDAAEQKDASVISGAVGWVLNALLSGIALILGHLTVLAAKIFDLIAQNIIDITEMPRVVNVGWGIVRDISNMFFILILIVIALTAILRIESYDYKHLMGEVILMAILVNFSEVIAVTIMNFVNYIAAIFYGNGFGFSELYLRLMYIAGAFDSAKTQWDQAIAGGWTGAMTIGVGRIVFMLVAFVVFLMLAALFLIRLIGLYILVIFSPIAYVARILPATEKYSEEWWSHFIKYLIWAPVAMFMLRLTFLISDNGGLEGFEQQGNSSLTFFILTGFMAAAVLVAKEAGMVGGGAIFGLGKKLTHKAGKLAWSGVKAGGNYGAEKYLEKYHKDIRPAKWIEGWKNSRDINRQQRELAGAAGAYDKGSVMADPTAFFQRYLGKGGMKKFWGGGTKTGLKLMEDAKELNDKADAPLGLRKKAEEAQKAAADLAWDMATGPALDATAKAAVILEIKAKVQLKKDLLAQAIAQEKAMGGAAGIKEMRDEAAALELRGKSLLYPDDYFTQKKIRHAMEEEKKNIHTDNWHELVDLFNGAVAEGKQARASAILMHLTDTYNENELVNKTRYDESMLEKQADGSMKIIGADGKEHQVGELMSYSTGGMEDFRKQVLEKKLGLGEQGSMLIMSDVSDLAEQRGHRNIMRMYETHHGKMVKKSEKDIQAEQAGENAKIDDSKVLRDGHRLMFYNEIPDGKGGRTTEITSAGLTYYVTNYQAVKNRVNRNEMNASQAKAAAQNARAIFAAAANISDLKERHEYQEVMSALVDFGKSKMNEAGEESRLDTVYDRLTGSPAPALTAPGENISAIPGYIPDATVGGKDLRAYLHKKT